MPGQSSASKLVGMGVRDVPSALLQTTLGVADDVGELLVPRTCACCRAYGQVMRGRGVLCPVCERLVALSCLNLGQVHGSRSGLTTVTAGLYQYELATAILAFKNGGRFDLLPLLRSALMRAAREVLAPYEYRALPAGGVRVLVVPLPSSPASVRRRGFEPAAELARALPRLLGNSLHGIELVYVPALRYRRSFPAPGASSQKLLGRQARSRRMHGALTLRQPVGGWAGRRLDVAGELCLLCDDVVTTGASFAEAERVLRLAGAEPIGAAAVARVPLPRGDKEPAS